MPSPEQLDRIAKAARAVGKTSDVVVPHLLEVADELREAIAFTDADARTFGLRIDLPVDDRAVGRVTTLQSGVTSSRALASAVAARKGAIRIESALGIEKPPARGLGGGFAAVMIAGPARLDTELDTLAALGVGSEPCAAVRARLRDVAGDGGDMAPRTLRVIGYRGPDGDNTLFEVGVRAPESIIGNLNAHAGALQIPRWQLAALEGLAGAPQSVRAIVRDDVVVPGVVLSYNQQPLAVVKDLIVKLAVTYDAWLRFAEMCSVFSANSVRRVDITLGVDRASASLGVDVN